MANQIIPYYAHPHVHTEIFDHSWFDDTIVSAFDQIASPYSTCVVTGADQGIDNTFIRLGTLRSKVALFGPGNFEKYGQSSLQADQLFDGNTNVWFCRVMPDNATYANMVVLAHFRKGNILDELNQETGVSRMEIKFSTAYANKPHVTQGAMNEIDIQTFAESLISLTPDPLTGYMTVPLFFIRSIGRGQYGNRYALRLNRCSEQEREYDLKMYRFMLLSHEASIRSSGMFTGSFITSLRYDRSMMITDVLDQLPQGFAPVSIRSYDDHFAYLFDWYQTQIVQGNVEFIRNSGTPEQIADLRFASNIQIDQFDPIFGLRMNTITNEEIPFYRNYTVLPEGPWIPPAKTIPDDGSANKPLNVADWNTAYVGARVLMVADPVNDGQRWMYTIVHIDVDTGDIIYNEGHPVAIDADQYDGVNLNIAVGNLLDGGHDGDFQEVNIDGDTRPPTKAEMKLLLSREYVKAFRGQKDRKILSPSRVNLDFMLDANYNMTSDETLHIDMSTSNLYGHSTVLTDADARALSIIGSSITKAIDFNDLNVKKAMWDLNEFRNRNGIVWRESEGAGCLLHLDCNLVGSASFTNHNAELSSLIRMMREFTGRNTSIDLGNYEIFDPITSKRIRVTTMYHLASRLTRHLVTQGLNVPFTYRHATLRGLRTERRRLSLSARGNVSQIGDMIRDTFLPDIELIDWDVKERLFLERINYYEATDEGLAVHRACQNTRQTDASALLEENNVRVLNTLKKNLERACKSYLYEWNEPHVRQGYTDAQMEIYRPWIGTMVDNLQIYFTANEWEEHRMIMRCWVEVAFRNITKRIIVEINITRPSEFGQLEPGVTVGETERLDRGGVL